MEIKDNLVALRKQHALSQDELAAILFVTRQAVSRWENGETTPNIDTLKLIANTFNISLDELMNNPVQICQSCGMTLEKETDLGTKEDGSKSSDYCAYCFQQGEFTHDMTLDEVIEHNLSYLKEYNKESKTQFTMQEARSQLKEFLPTLKRWSEME